MAGRNEADLVAEARTRIVEIAPADAMARPAGEALFVDVRGRNEWNLFRIAGARHVPFDAIEAAAASGVPRDRDVIVYCNRGNRSALVTDLLLSLGYTRVASLKGGVAAWVDAGGELED